ncbi:MAG: hypothetical protein ACLPSW_27145 [Roseiarcus sp.]
MKHRSKLPLTTRFRAAHLMATHSKGMSARELEDQLGVSYKSAWLLTQKLRRSMIDPDRDHLEGVVDDDVERVSDGFGADARDDRDVASDDGRPPRDGHSEGVAISKRTRFNCST